MFEIHTLFQLFLFFCKTANQYNLIRSMGSRNSMLTIVFVEKVQEDLIKLYNNHLQNIILTRS